MVQPPGLPEPPETSIPLPEPPVAPSDAPPPPPGTVELSPEGALDRGPDGTAAEERRSRAPVLLAVVLMLLVATGGWALLTWAGGDSGCDDGSFESPRFGYCVRTPSGWTVEGATADGDAAHDLFLRPTAASTITVTAVRLDRGQDLARFEQLVRGDDERAGATLDATTQLEVGGADAVAFELTLDGPDGTIRSREVLVAADGVAWRITLADDEAGFDASARQLDEMLESWRFT